MDSNQYVPIDKSKRKPWPGPLLHVSLNASASPGAKHSHWSNFNRGNMRLGTVRWLSRSHRQTFLQVGEPAREPGRLVPAEPWPQVQGFWGWGEGWKTEQQSLLGRGRVGVGLESRAANPEGRLPRADATPSYLAQITSFNHHLGPVSQGFIDDKRSTGRLRNLPKET